MRKSRIRQRKFKSKNDGLPVREAVLCGEIVAALCRSFCAVGVEGTHELAGDVLRGGLLDDGALHKVDQLAVAQNGDRRRAGRMAFEVAAGALRGFAVLTGKHSDLAIRRVGAVGERETDAGASFARRATANGVDE